MLKQLESTKEGLLIAFIILLSLQSEIFDAQTEGLMPPEVIKTVKPAYPSGITPREGGVKVTMNGVIEVDGSVTNASVHYPVPEPFEGYNEFAKESLKAWTKWTYKPGKLDGKSVRVRMVITTEFLLGGGRVVTIR